MKRTVVDTIWTNQNPVNTGTYFTRTVPIRGAVACFLAIYCDEAQTGTIAVTPGIGEVGHGDQTTTESPALNETLADGRVAANSVFASAATPGTQVWQYAVPLSLGTNNLFMVPRVMRFKYVIAGAALTKVTMKIVTIYDAPGGETERTTGASVPL